MAFVTMARDSFGPSMDSVTMPHVRGYVGQSGENRERPEWSHMWAYKIEIYFREPVEKSIYVFMSTDLLPPVTFYTKGEAEVAMGEKMVHVLRMVNRMTGGKHDGFVLDRKTGNLKRLAPKRNKK